MSKFTMPVGIEFFENLRRSGCYYVDKSELIYKVACSENTSVTLFTRPRRFGKTLTMSMFQSFFDISRDSRDVFEGLEVVKHEEFCSKWMNQYPVLFLSLKDVAGLEFESAYGMLESKIADLCKAHFYLADSKKVNDSDKRVFYRLCDEAAKPNQVKSSLLTLTRMMHAHYDKPVIFLLDEYDVPLAKAHDADKAEKDYYPKMLDVARGLMSCVLKTNPFLKFAVITGCLRIAKESIFTGVNHFSTYSILDEEFSDSFGFTQKEVKQVLEKAGLPDRLELVKSWYDGYIFGNTEIFCPWDVASYVDAAGKVSGQKPENYWKDTSSNDIVSEFVGNPKFKVAKKFETLMNGGTIEQTITDRLTYGSLKSSEDNLWSVLFMTGYLTKSDKTEKGDTVHLKIPNAEIESIFEESVTNLFEKNLDFTLQDNLMEAFWGKDEKTASEIITRLLWKTISYNDYHENYYHAFITGIFVGHSYEVGSTDLIIWDSDNRRVIIIEAKKANAKKDMEKMCLEGVQQIADKKYYMDPKFDGFKEIICYGISFYKKDALVRLGYSTAHS